MVAPRILALVPLAALLQIADAQTGTPVFQGLQTEVGVNPYRIVLADFDADGKLDAATANAYDYGISNLSGDVTVLCGDGTGGFHSRAEFEVGSSPEGIAAGDVDGDGRVDIVTANALADTITVLWGDGTGGFPARTDVAVGDGPIAVALADLDLDGRLDVVTADFLGGSLSVLFRDDTRGFAPRVALGVFLPTSIAVGDIDGDGIPDVVFTDINQSTVGWRKGLSGRAFGGTRGTLVGDSPFAVAVGDVNGDEKLDVATANAGANNVSVCLGNGNGGFFFFVQRDYPVGSGVRDVVLVDLDGDSDLDLAAANSSSLAASVSVLENDGSGAYGAALEVPAGKSPFGLATGDLDGDGDADIATANVIDSESNYPGFVTVLLGEGSAGIPAPERHSTRSSSADLGFGDMDRDGLLDLVTAGTAGNVNVCLGDGEAGFETCVGYVSGSSPESVALGDLDGDGVLDVVVGRYLPKRVAVLFGDGAGGLSARTDYTVPGLVEDVALGDIDRDGALDIVEVNLSTSGVQVLFGDGLGTFGNPITYSSLPHAALALGDVNADGALDAVSLRSQIAEASVFLGDALGQLGPATTYATGLGARCVALDDLDGDGDLDLATGNGYETAVSVLLGDGLGAFPTHVEYGQSAFPLALGNVQDIRIGDVNGDTHPDLVASNAYYLGNALVFLGDGSGAFPSFHGVSFDGTPTTVALGDLDRDGRLDLVAGLQGIQWVGISTNLRAGNASAMVRGGLQGNRAFYSSTLPLLGSTWTAEVDSTGHSGASLTAILGYAEPWAGTATAFGELLIHLGSPRLFASYVPIAGGVGLHWFAIPNDPALADIPFFTQAALLGGGIELGNAIDGVLGY